MLGRVIEDDFNICMNFWCWAHECSGEWVFFSLFVAGKRMKKTIETESLQMMMRDCSIAVEIALLISQQLENFLCFPFKSSRAFLLHNYFPLAHVNSSAINRRHCSMNHGLCEAIEREIFHVSSARGILKANFKFITFIKSHQVGGRRQRDGGKKLCVKLLLLLLSFFARSMTLHPAFSQIHIMFLGRLLVLGNKRRKQVRGERLSLFYSSLTLSLNSFVCKTKLIFIRIINSIFYFIYGFDRARERFSSSEPDSP